MFTDRAHAGQLLAKELHHYKNDPNAVVLAIPRGGIVPGFVIAQELNLPLEIKLVKKIGHPINKECAIGAISLNHRIITSSYGADERYIDEETERVKAKLFRQNELFRKGRSALSLANKNVIVVDDGIATGNTLKMVIQLVRQERPTKIIAAIPVSPSDTLRFIETMADETICLDAPEYFNAVGAYYKHFDQVEDQEVVRLLEKANT